MSDALALMQLLRLVSPALPVGAFAYSQGLEWQVETGAVRDRDSAGRWLEGVLRHALGRCEAPLLHALITAWKLGDQDRVAALNARFLASRESGELRAETVQMGASCRRWLLRLPAVERCFVDALSACAEPAYPTAWSCATVAFAIPASDARLGYLWSWLENQVLAAVKLVPMGQSEGQDLLARLMPLVAEVADAAATIGDDEWSNFAPAFAIASARHEGQYSRLFRS